MKTLVLLSLLLAITHAHDDSHKDVDDQIAMEDRVFKTSKHHGHRAYYLLKDHRQQQQQRHQSQMARWPQSQGSQKTYGIWYPNQPAASTTSYTYSTNNKHVSMTRGHPQPHHQPHQQHHQQLHTSPVRQPQTNVFTTRRGDTSLPLPDQLRARRFNKLLDLIELAGLEKTLSNMRESFTLFAPTDEAITAFLESQPEGVVTTLTEEMDVLKALLLHHVVPGNIAFLERNEHPA